MRILWVTNMPPDTISKELTIPINNGGGWLSQMSMMVSQEHDLTIAFAMNSHHKMIEGKAGKIHYIGFPFIRKVHKDEDKQIDRFITLIQNVKPDIIHIWGTEYVHSYLVFKACCRLKLLDRTLVYIQGLVSECQKVYWCYIDSITSKIPTIKDLIRGSGPAHEYKDFAYRSEYEVRVLKEAKHVIGRTKWDRECIESLNPSVSYHVCNETLRKEFYQGKWDLLNCCRHRIFISQGNYPLKGLHLALEGISRLVDDYPDIVLVCTGKDRCYPNLRVRMRESSYDRYIRKLIHRYSLEKHVMFTGNLNAEEMKRQYLMANVFLSASSIENSSNSISEAMLLGTPVISSDVGGVKDMIRDEREGLLYQVDSISDMTKCIKRLFDNGEYARCLSSKAQERARHANDPNVNYQTLMEIYASLFL